LAIISTQPGKNVFLLDANMNEPVQQNAFKLDRAPGLSNFLIDTATPPDSWREYSKPSSVSGLTVMTAGSPIHDTAALLESDRFRDLLKAISESFDLVLIDTPPVLTTIDAVIVAHESDGSILVVDSADTSISDAKRAKDVLASNGNILGVVFNQSVRDSGKVESSSREKSKKSAAILSDMRIWFLRLLGPRPG
jgi:capsular exopolysaccharide synthesis family protein